ncbi:MAG: hypothetical protein JWP75_1250 [Frondihabitans sp.]|nr:hypothetical protein [Frondihabitans sp.]
MDEERRRRPSRLAVDRLVTFSDAVVAIAITLVALPLVDVARETSSPEEFFRTSGYALTAAAISFFVIGTFWRDHHYLFLRATDYPPVLLRVLLVWLAAIVFLPVATVIEVRAPGENKLAYVLYIGTIFVAMVSYRLEELLLFRAGHLEVTHNGEWTRREQLIEWIPATLVVIAAIVSVTLPSLGLWSLVLIALGTPLKRMLHSWASAPRRPSFR